MAKQGMKRPERTHTQQKNDVSPIPEIQGKAKHGKMKANPIIVGATGTIQKVYHAKPHSKEKSVSSIYPEINTDLARDNYENDLPDADIQDLE